MQPDLILKRACIMLRVLTLIFLMFSIFCSVSYAADLAALQDKFYGGLGAVIENNMDDSEQCLKAVDQYYAANEALVVQLREKMKKAMTQAAPMMQKMVDKYSSMSEEEAQALEKQYEGKEPPRPQLSAAMTRYSKAVATFSQKYPYQAMELAGKIMRIMMDPQQMQQMQEVN